MAIKPKMYYLTVDSADPQSFMVYAPTQASAKAKFMETFVRADLATALEIAAHVRAEKPIIGEPAPPVQGSTGA